MSDFYEGFTLDDLKSVCDGKGVKYARTVSSEAVLIKLITQFDENEKLERAQREKEMEIARVQREKELQLEQAQRDKEIEISRVEREKEMEIARVQRENELEADKEIRLK